MAVDRALDLVKVLIGIGALASLPLTGPTLGTTKQLLESWKSGKALIKAVGNSGASAIEGELVSCLNSHFATFQDEPGMVDTARLVMQMIEQIDATPANIAQCNLDAARLTETLLAAFAGVSDYQAPAVQSLFRATVTDAYTRLFANSDFVASVTPALWEKVLKGQEAADDKADSRHQEQMTFHRQTDEYRRMRDAQITENAIFKLITQSENMTDNPADSWAQFQAWVDTAIKVQTEGAQGSNHADFVDRVLARVAELSRNGDYDVASASID